MIPLALVTGFLGSGKTTLLRHIIEKNRTRKIAYLVNEFSSLDVDGEVLADTDADVMSIPGGSIFCQCLVTQFIGTLRTVAEKFDRLDAPLVGVVVEASGIADPRVIGKMLEETRLDRVYQLGQIVSVVDPGSFTKLLKTLPNITAQIEACDLAVINKTDLYEESQIVSAEREVCRIHPAATVLRTQFGRVDTDLFAHEGHEDLQGQYALCADPNYHTFRAKIDRPVMLDHLLADIEKVRSAVYRIKGFVPAAGGAVYLDVSESGVVTMPIDDDRETGELAFIAHPAGRADVADMVHRLEEGTFSIQP